MAKDFIDKVALIHIKERQILMALSRENDVYYTPGGKREGAESDEQALVREIKEELNVEILPETIKHYGTFEDQAHGKPKGTMVRIICYLAKFTGDPKPGAEIRDLAYYNYAQRDIIGATDQLIFDDLKNKGLIE